MQDIIFGLETAILLNNEIERVSLSSFNRSLIIDPILVDKQKQREKVLEYINFMGTGLSSNKDFLYFSMYCPSLYDEIENGANVLL